MNYGPSMYKEFLCFQISIASFIDLQLVVSCLQTSFPKDQLQPLFLKGRLATFPSTTPLEK